MNSRLAYGRMGAFNELNKQVNLHRFAQNLRSMTMNANSMNIFLTFQFENLQFERNIQKFVRKKENNNNN